MCKSTKNMKQKIRAIKSIILETIIILQSVGFNHEHRFSILGILNLMLFLILFVMFLALKLKILQLV